MSRARTLAGAIGSDGTLNVADVGGLANVASSGSATDLTTGTLPIARIADGAVVNAKLGTDLDASKLTAGTLPIARIADAAVTSAKLASGAAVSNIGYTPLNKAGDTLTGNLELGGKVIRDTSGTGRVYHNLTPAYDLYNSGNTAGAIVIDTNIPFDASNMCGIQIAGYSYNTGQHWEINLSGYFGEGNFYAMRATSLDHPFGVYIRAAKKTATNKMSFILGDTGTVYGTSVFVERFIQTYSNQTSSYADGWTVSRITSTSAYSSVTNISVYTPVMTLPAVTTSNVKAAAPGAFGYGVAPYNYVLGWAQYNASSGNTYLHIKTSLWGGGSPAGNSMYIMGGFRITGYRYSTENIDDLIQFHNWSGSIAGLVKTSKATDVGNTVYIGSDGYVYLRLASSSSYVAYNIDLYQTLIYSTRDIYPVSTTFSNSASL